MPFQKHWCKILHHQKPNPCKPSNKMPHLAWIICLLLSIVLFAKVDYFHKLYNSFFYIELYHSNPVYLDKVGRIQSRMVIEVRTNVWKNKYHFIRHLSHLLLLWICNIQYAWIYIYIYISYLLIKLFFESFSPIQPNQYSCVNFKNEGIASGS